MYNTDVTIKVYNRGNLAGKLALFFESDKAKKVFDKLGSKLDYILAYDAALLPKAETFCTTNQLHYQIIELN